MLKDLREVTCEDIRDLERKEFEDSIKKVISVKGADFPYIVDSLKYRYSYSMIRQKIVDMVKEGKLTKIKCGHYYTYLNNNIKK